MFAQFVGDRLVGRRDVARGLHRLRGRCCGGRRRGGRRGRGVGRLGSLCRRGGDVGRLRIGSFCRRARRGCSGRFRLGCVGHRRGGVELEIGGGRRRNVGGFGTRDRGFDREFGSAAARRILAASAEVADTVRKVAATVIKTRSNPARWFEQSRIVAPLGRTAPAWNSLQLSFLIASAKRAGLSQVARLHATIQTQTIHAPLSAASATRDNSRQTDLKHAVCNGLCAFATRFSVCLSLPSHGSKVPNQRCEL